MKSSSSRIIVIGMSAGGMQALTKLLAQLPENLAATILIVQHLSADSSTHFLVQRLRQYTKLACKVAEHDDTLQEGTVYLAQADLHLLLKEGKMLVVRGPRENQFRPAIDPFFRSAAATHGANVIGIVLTGFMSDGVLGMEAIKRSGGITVVQHPEDAEFPALPQNVMRQVEVDYVLPVKEMGSLLTKLVQEEAPEGVTIPTDIWQEAKIVERIMTNSTKSSIDELDQVGTRAPYSCPDCGGGLWELTQPGTTPRYRCHSGHAYSQDSLLLGMSNHLEETLWVAMRTLEERRNILLHMSNGETTKGNHRWATLQEEKAEEMKVHIERLRSLLTQSALADRQQMGETG